MRPEEAAPAGGRVPQPPRFFCIELVSGPWSARRLIRRVRPRARDERLQSRHGLGVADVPNRAHLSRNRPRFQDPLKPLVTVRSMPMDGLFSMTVMTIYT